MKLKQALSQARELLETNHIEDSRFEAELLLRHVLNIDRVHLYLDLDRELRPEEDEAYRSCVSRRRQGEPSAYIMKRREFYGLDFYVDSSVLIPRPETELLAEKAVNLAKEGNTRTIAEIGTGSGAIAICLALQLPLARIYATDTSEQALKVARLNAEKFAVLNKIHFLHGDLLEPLPEAVDLLVANPPYVKGTEINQCLSFEPRLALNGGADGLETIYRLCRGLDAKLNTGGQVLLEIGMGQAQPLAEYLASIYPSVEFETFTDPGDVERVFSFRLTPKKAKC